MMIYMVPTLSATFKGLGVDLPLSTRIIIAISDFLKNNILTLVLGVIVAAVLFALDHRVKAECHNVPSSRNSATKS